MKTVLLFIFLTISGLGFSQVDYVSIPQDVAVKIMLDLNRKDELEELYSNQLLEIKELGRLSRIQDSLINDRKLVIKSLEQTIELKDMNIKKLEDDNKQLKADNHTLKTKNKFILGGSGIIIAGLIILSILK